MAKRRNKTKRNKGKSQRRVKDWNSRMHVGREIDDIDLRINTKQNFSAKAVKLRDDNFADNQAAEDNTQDLVSGIVTGVFRRATYVRVGGQDLFCAIAKTFRVPEGAENSTPIAVGDSVTVALADQKHTSGQTEIDKNRMDGMIVSRNSRETVLARPAPRSAKRNSQYQEVPEKVIAANMDQLLLVAATESPAVSQGLIDRFLITAQRGKLHPILVINKIDIADPDPKIIEDVTENGAEIIYCSAKTGQGIDKIRKLLGGKKTVLAGLSGVGKSTIINNLIPEAQAATRTVREKDQRGRHTTSQSRVYDLDCGGMIVDTPGIRELGVAATQDQLAWYFPEFENFVNSCKFRNCTHTHEPGCAVQQAVEQGEIKLRRYDAYLRILETIEEN